MCNSQFLLFYCLLLSSPLLVSYLLLRKVEQLLADFLFEKLRVIVSTQKNIKISDISGNFVSISILCFQLQGLGILKPWRLWASKSGLKSLSCTQTQISIIHHLYFTTTNFYMQKYKDYSPMSSTSSPPWSTSRGMTSWTGRTRRPPSWVRKMTVLTFPCYTAWKFKLGNICKIQKQ